MSKLSTDDRPTLLPTFMHREELTKLDGGEERLISQAPFGRLWDLGLVEDPSPYFGLRLVTLREATCRGNKVRQALVDYLGSPAWINVSFYFG